MTTAVTRAVLFVALLGFVFSQTSQVSSVSQYGITWTFDKHYTSGTFANGDYWVLGPIQITSITPSPNNNQNGTMVNPTASMNQAFDSRAQAWTAASGVTEFPLVIPNDSSIVSSISRTDCASTCRPAVDIIAVLTVLSSIPPNNGATVFRPSYCGLTKQMWSTSDLNLANLPVYPQPVSNDVPTLDTIATRFSRPWIDYLSSWAGDSSHPRQNMPNYAGDIAVQVNEAALRFMLNDSTMEQKMPALINFLQYGVDLFGCISTGTFFPANGGHALGRLVPLAYAAFILNGGESMLPVINSTRFGEWESIVVGNGGQALWGQITTMGEDMYWTNQMDQSGARTSPDPYGFIDGGQVPGQFYQAVNAPNFKATALIAYMFPQVQRVVNRKIFYEFVERYVANGTWTQPDPCAGFDGNTTNYRITFGPDGNGGCILDTDPSDGIGRFPDLHGMNVDSGNSAYTSIFCNDMWTNFRHQLAGFNPPGSSSPNSLNPPGSSYSPNSLTPSSPPSSTGVSGASVVNPQSFVVLFLAFAVLAN